MTTEVRIDKYLFAVRLYKTRGLASDACRLGRVSVDNLPAKPSRYIKQGQTLTIKKAPVTYTYKILNLTENRVSAKLVPDFIEDLTPESEKQRLEESRQTGFSIYRKKGLGRPTKKERREIDRLTDEFYDL